MYTGNINCSGQILLEGGGGDRFQMIETNPKWPLLVSTFTLKSYLYYFFDIYLYLSRTLFYSLSLNKISERWIFKYIVEDLLLSKADE